MDGGCDGYPIVELDSDMEDVPSSSEDEIDVILNGTPKQKRALRRRSLGQKSSSEDEFEKELEAELNKRMNSIVKAQNGQQTPPSGTGSSAKSDQKQKKATTEEFRESSSDEEETQQGAVVPAADDEELLYDPDLDDLDQQWVDRQRRSYQVGGGAHHKTPSSDAVLCCPACMVVLSRDCQRHSLYKNQFRAMFVTNCSVDKSEVLRFPTQQQQKRSKKAKKSKILAGETPAGCSVAGSDENGLGDNDKYHPVHCTSCTSQVAMLDSDEVYHFFNVLEGNG